MPDLSLTDYILEQFWEKWPAIRDDPAELAIRVARRHRAEYSRPPRAWCVALRASDTRINPNNVSFVYSPCYDNLEPHDILVHQHEIAPLVAPVYIDPPYEEWLNVAARLGVHEECLRYHMKNGFFRVHKFPLWRGKRGKPTPMLYREGALDPSAAGFVTHDVFWDSASKWHHTAIPDNLDQILRRSPDWRVYRRNSFDRRFRGWRWICPKCNNKCKTLCLPLPVPTVEEYLRIHPGHPELDAPPLPLSEFACVRCHRVRYITRVGSDGWNQFVSYLTCGLLYGREVPKPDWWKVRRRAYRPCSNRPAPPLLNEVLELLTTTDLSPKEISLRLRIPIHTIYSRRKRLYAMYNVHSREELKEEIERPTPEPIPLFGRVGS